MELKGKFTLEAYQYLPESCRANRDLAMLAVSHHGPALLHVPEVLDEEIPSPACALDMIPILGASMAG
eukprot:3863706-Amphidinium_carterae.3